VRNRRFPPPWSVEERDACFVVRDHDGQQLAYVYFEDEQGRRFNLHCWSGTAGSGHDCRPNLDAEGSHLCSRNQCNGRQHAVCRWKRSVPIR
jgi:hypothetical protein